MPTSVLIAMALLWPMSERPPPSKGHSAPRPGSPTSDQQRLRRAAEPAVLVVQDRLGQPDPVRTDARDRVEVHPFAGRLAHEMDRQLGVDEQVLVVVERRADA